MRQKIPGLGDASLRARFVLVASGRSTNSDTANDLVTYLGGETQRLDLELHDNLLG
jgi:hypothetical protein